MHNEVTGSIRSECNERLEVLYRNSHEWLLKVSYNICKSRLESQDMVGELYVYLAEKCNPKLYYEDSYNLIYCMRFISSRWINKVKRNKKMQYVPTIQSESINEEYNITLDNDIMDAHQQVLKEIDRLKKTRQFSSARIYELYWCEGDDTLQELADKIGISKSTVFIHLKRIRQHLKGIIKNPFDA